MNPFVSVGGEKLVEETECQGCSALHQRRGCQVKNLSKLLRANTQAATITVIHALFSTIKKGLGQ